MKRLLIYISLAVLFWLSSCQVRRHIPQNEHLLIENTLDLHSEYPISGKLALKTELDELLKPVPNTKILGARILLWAYFKSKDTTINKYSKQFASKYGQKPVYFSNVDTNRTKLLIQNRLENRGYYASKIQVHLESDKKGDVAIDYHVHLSRPYVLRNFTYIGDSLDISKRIRKTLEKSPLQKGWRYDLDALKNERLRIAEYLKRKGYYEFRPDYLIFKIDTNQQSTHDFDLYLSLKTDAPAESITPYYIKNITVYSDYAVADEEQHLDTTRILYDSIVYIEGEKKFKVKYLNQFVLIRPGDLYSQRMNDNTISRLSAIGTFKYVTIRYRHLDSLDEDPTDKRFLDAEIYLSNFKKKGIRMEIQALGKSNNFFGPQFLANFRNRSVFHAGELFSVTGKMGFETQFTQGQKTGLYSFTFGLQADLVFPRFIAPFNIRVGNTYTVPKTKISASYDILNRVQYYRFVSGLLSYGYKWNSSALISHEMNPISINYVIPSNITAAFEQILLDNPYLKTSFQQQLILGLTYGFQYNELLKKQKRNSIFFQVNTDFSGNVIRFIQNQTEGKSEYPKQIAGQPYAQYSKYDIDFRVYHKVKRASQIIFRIYQGVGYSYGNSTQLPYMKMFFSGGPYGLRAFRARGVGPGSYVPTSNASQNYWDQTGDFKLEGNIEYRFPIFSVLKGAWFVDAGNVWLIRDNPALPGGKLSSSWYKELALGGGVGARIDIQYFVVRFDLATPLRSPSLPEGERWTGLFNLNDSQGFYKSLILNFAIGYPF